MYHFATGASGRFLHADFLLEHSHWACLSVLVLRNMTALIWNDVVILQVQSNCKTSAFRSAHLVFCHLCLALFLMFPIFFHVVLSAIGNLALEPKDVT